VSAELDPELLPHGLMSTEAASLGAASVGWGEKNPRPEDRPLRAVTAGAFFEKTPGEVFTPSHAARNAY
jgi:hypothetical protein